MGNAMSMPAFVGIGAASVALITSTLHNGFGAMWSLLYNIAKKRAKLYPSTFRHNKRIAFAALFGGPVGITCNFLGIRYAGVYAIAIASSYPVISALIEKIVFRRKISKMLFTGLLLGVAGAYLIANARPSEIDPHVFLLGILFSIAAAAGWALEGLITSSCLHDDAPESVVLGINQTTAFIMTAVAIPFFLQHSEWRRLPQIADAKMILFIAVIAVAGIVSLESWYASIHTLGPTKAMGLNTSYILWAVVFQFLINAAGVSAIGGIGILVIFAGALLVVGANRPGVEKAEDL